MKKSAFLLMLMFLLLLVMICCAEEEGVFSCDNYQYVLTEDGTALITGYMVNDKEIKIPEELDGHKVTGIKGEAFFLHRSLTSVSIPDSVIEIGTNPFAMCSELCDIRVSSDQPVFAVIDGVLFNKVENELICYPKGLDADTYVIPQGIRKIGDLAFYNCDSITAITIPDSVTSIGDSAFYYCDALTDITIPDSVIEMGDNPFARCYKLEEIKVSPTQPMFAVLDGVLFDKAEKKLICYPPRLNTDTYVIPQGTRKIGKQAFLSCCSLTTVIIPDSVTSIGKDAFSEGYFLTTVIIPDGVKSIGDHAFSINALTTVTIPDSVTNIGEGAFSGNRFLTSVTISAPISGDLLPLIFDDCSAITFTVPRGSELAAYCEENGLNYTYPDANDWLLN